MFFFLSSAVVATLLAAAEASTSILPSSGATCAAAKSIENAGRFHAPTSCNLAGYNEYKRSMGRNQKYNSLRASGVQLVPDMKTVHCPAEQVELKPEHFIHGFDTMFIAENTASSPVVVAWVGHDGVEYSARNSKIAPASADREAILAPGEWRAYHTHEGHVFHIREMLDDGSAGDLLVQHRVGLVPIGERFQDLDCPLADPEPIVNKTRDPEYTRTPPAPLLPCNTIDIGFRNVANCPLHGYWISPDPPQGDGGNSTCGEQFKFHLGKDPLPADFMWQWQSPTKFESSYIGNAFAFRSAADPNILVDTYTMAPVTVTDCPRSKSKVSVMVGSDGVLVGVGRNQQLPSAFLANTTGAGNATNPARRRISRSSLAAGRYGSDFASLY